VPVHGLGESDSASAVSAADCPITTRPATSAWRRRRGADPTPAIDPQAVVQRDDAARFAVGDEHAARGGPDRARETCLRRADQTQPELRLVEPNAILLACFDRPWWRQRIDWPGAADPSSG